MARILVVDDDAADRNALAGLLTSRGHDISGISCAVKALEIARTDPPDLIVADILMPEMDGFEFARQIRRETALDSIRLIFYTARYAPASVVALAEACGVTHVLSKRASPESILAAIDSVLHAPGSPSEQIPDEFDRQHARVLTEKILDQLDELRDANQRLGASESHYRSLFEINPVPMWILADPGRSFLAVNEAAVQQYGYSRQEFSSLALANIELPAETGKAGPRQHRTKRGQPIDVTILSRETSFDGSPATLQLVEDVTEKNRTEREIRESKASLHELTVRLRSAHEEERTRIARYLHDELGQMLTALRMTCGWMASRLPAGQPLLLEKMQSCTKLTDDLVVAVQRLSTDLRPGILDLGLGAAVEWYVREFQTRSDIACTVEVPEDDDPIDSACATEIYRILQEALTNVARHSGASRVNVSLTRQGTALVLEVHDNGRGITPGEIDSRNSIGLLGMKERAALVGGTMSIEGSPQTGTTLRVTACGVRPPS